MPTCEYHCNANGATLAIRRGMHELIATWGAPCARAQLVPGHRPADAPVAKVFTTGNVIRRENLGSGVGPPPACGSGVCGGGTCQYG